MFKCRERFNTDVDSIVKVVIDPKVREQWDTKIVDWKLYFSTPDHSYSRLSFNFISPAKPFVDDRDFYLLQLVRRDFPEKGDVTLFQKSLPPHEECPNVRGRVRADMCINSLVYRPVIQNGKPTGQTDVFMISCIDIKGAVPKFLVNSMSASVPRENFAEFQAAAVALAEGKFDTKYKKKK